MKKIFAMLFLMLTLPMAQVSAATQTGAPGSSDRLKSTERNLSDQGQGAPNVVVTETQVYMWRDHRGVTHYTDDPKKAPKGAKIHSIQTVRQGQALNSSPENSEQDKPQQDRKSVV